VTNVSIVEDNNNQKELKDNAEYQPSEKGKMNDKMIVHNTQVAIVTRKRNHSYDNSIIMNSPYYDQHASPNNMHSNTEDNREFKRLHKSSYQETAPTEASSNSAKREDKRRSQNSPGDATHASSSTKKTRPDPSYASRTIEHKFLEDNLMESLNSRSSAYLHSPSTSLTHPQMRPQSSMLENVYNSGDMLRSYNGAGTLDMLDALHREPNVSSISLRNQSILTQSTSILENEKRRCHIALQGLERAKASRTKNLQTEMNRMYAKKNNIPNTVHGFKENQAPANIYASNANSDDIRSERRNENHVSTSTENHHGLSRTGSAAFNSNQLMSTNVPETSLANHDRRFIHLSKSKNSSFSENIDVSLRQGHVSHPSDHQTFPLERLRPHSSPYGMTVLRRQHESIDPDQVKSRISGLPELPYHFRGRLFVPLGTIEDEIWLSPFLCFLRSQCIEMFRAKDVDVSYRRSAKTKVEINQIGIRCRFCAHKPYKSRGKRSSSFPSSVSRIYQSVTMMIREHFHSCSEFPQEVRKRYCTLKGETKKGELESKRYWAQSAAKMGMTDTEKGIFCPSLIESGQLH